MSFSKYLNSKRDLCKELVSLLSKHFSYVSILGTDVKGLSVMVTTRTTQVGDTRDQESGFVVKMNDGKSFFEYATDKLEGSMEALAQTILDSVKVEKSLIKREINVKKIEEESLVKSFERQSDLDSYSTEALLDFCQKTIEQLKKNSNHYLNCNVSIQTQDISKMFISSKKELDQAYTWVNGYLMAVYKNNDKVVSSREGANSFLMSEVLEKLPTRIEALTKKCECLTKATPITPGFYDVITDPTITGLIAHEAFGHGVEMDQFVKDRALAKKYVGDYVASPICNMKDGANSTLSVASYFFDDDGVLAGDTQIIKNGILVSGISDLASASQLETIPTGNGRRENFSHKAYSRMTNTFFEKGTDKLEDMISSIKHGYMLFETNNGMEDPKNWAIQCVCEYGIEIIDGKLTDHYVSPVVMSGYVPDLLKSISMISDDFNVEGSGSCGKGYKEWVRVSDGGPALKAKVKLA